MPCSTYFFYEKFYILWFSVFSLAWKQSKYKVRLSIILYNKYFIYFVADCELLLLYKEDFDNILRPTLEAKHENITKALQRFEYFNNYTVEKVRTLIANTFSFLFIMWSGEFKLIFKKRLRDRLTSIMRLAFSCKTQ